MAKRNNDNGPIDSYEDLEMEDIDDFDPFDVLDDSYDDRRVYKNPKAPKSTYMDRLPGLSFSFYRQFRRQVLLDFLPTGSVLRMSLTR